jgi:hypothetical protein
MRRGIAALGLCLMLLLAGCSLLPGGSQDSPAPGVEDGALADADALLEAHESTLTESGYSHDLTINQTVETANGSFQDDQRQRMAVAPGASQYLRQVIYVGQGRVVAWGNETVEYQRIDSGTEPQYRSTSPESATAMTGADALEPHLTAPYEVVDTEETDDRTLVTLSTTGDPSDESAFPENTSSVDRYDAELVVDGDGRIHRLNVSAAYEADGYPGTYEFRYELTDASDPGVERPAWVDDVASAAAEQ